MSKSMVRGAKSLFGGVGELHPDALSLFAGGSGFGSSILTAKMTYSPLNHLVGNTLFGVAGAPGSPSMRTQGRVVGGVYFATGLTAFLLGKKIKARAARGFVRGFGVGNMLLGGVLGFYGGAPISY